MGLFFKVISKRLSTSVDKKQPLEKIVPDMLWRACENCVNLYEGNVINLSAVWRALT